MRCKASRACSFGHVVSAKELEHPDRLAFTSFGATSLWVTPDPRFTRLLLGSLKKPQMHPTMIGIIRSSLASGQPPLLLSARSHALPCRGE